VLRCIEEVFLVDLQGLAAESVTATVYQQEHHAQVVRSQLVTILRSALPTAGGTQQLLDNV
jgi:hypothetical protein